MLHQSLEQCRLGSVSICCSECTICVVGAAPQSSPSDSQPVRPRVNMHFLDGFQEERLTTYIQHFLTQVLQCTPVFVTATRTGDIHWICSSSDHVLPDAVPFFILRLT